MASFAIDVQHISRSISGRVSSLSNIWPAALLLYAILVPPEVALYAGSFKLGVYRIVLFLLIPWLFMQLARGRIKFGGFDFAMLIVALWLPISFGQNYDFMTGLEAGGSQTVDMMIPYLVGRASIRSLVDLRGLLKMVLPGLVAAGSTLMLESISGSLFVRETFQSVFGGASEVGGEIRYEYRRGLLRAYGPFSHPIHAGMYLTAYVPLFFMVFRDKIWRLSGLLPGLLGIFSLSSAGLLGLVLSMGLVGYDWLQKQIKEIGWRMFLIVTGASLAAIQMLSSGGVVSVIYRYLTFNPATGWYRTRIWLYSIDDIWTNPWFGLGYEEYTRPSWHASSSIDAHYLAMAVKYGLVPALTYFFIAVGLVIFLGACARKGALSSQRDAFVGMAICVVTIVTILFTVTIWGAALVWFNLIIGIFISVCRNENNYKLLP